MPLSATSAQVSEERNMHFSHLTACELKSQTCKTAVRISTNSVVQWTVQQKAQLNEIWKLKNKTTKNKRTRVVLSRIWTAWCLKKYIFLNERYFSKENCWIGIHAASN